MWQVVAVSIVPASVGVVCAMFRHDIHEARARLAAQPTRILHSTYGDIQYRVTGEGVPILVSHGITGGVDQAESLVTKARNLPPNYRFVYVSRFGYLGSSLPPKATVRMQAAAYRELLDHLMIDRVFLVGNSAGGPSTTWFAIGYPERTQGLILLSSAVPGPVPDPIPPLVAKHDFVYWAAVKAAPGSLLSMLMPKSVIQSMSKEDKAEAVALSLLASMPISQRTEGIRFDNQVTVPGINDVPFEQVTRPTLIFQAVDDPRENAGGRQMAERIPNSKFVGLTGGHLLLGHQAEIRATIADFVEANTS
jgi:pimeloyl-ACP methyl ester carboxylesterase